MKTYEESGEVLTLAAPYAVLSGQGALVGSIFGVAQADAANGAPVVLVTRGVVTIAKTSAEAYTVGLRIYWDNATRLATSNAGAGANRLIGVATVAAANPSGTCRVLLTGAFTI